MTPRSRLALASVGFAVLWTAFMWWWSAPLETGPVILLLIIGVIAGFGWYWGMSKWAQWQSSRRDSET